MIAQREVVVSPVSEADDSLRSYPDIVGFSRDVDHSPAINFRVIRRTPQGATKSVEFGIEVTDTPIGFVSDKRREDATGGFREHVNR